MEVGLEHICAQNKNKIMDPTRTDNAEDSNVWNYVGGIQNRFRTGLGVWWKTTFPIPRVTDFTKMSRPAVGPTQSPIQCVPFFSGVKIPERDVGH